MKYVVYDVAEFEKKTIDRVGKKLGLSLELTEKSLDLSSLSMAKDAYGVTVLGYSHVDEELLEKMAEMGIRAISTRTIGFDHIDIEAAKRLNIRVSNSRYEAYNVADFTVMMLLILLRKAKISICRALVNDFSLDGMMGREVRSLTIGIIGTGRIGTAVVKNLSGFGCRILCYSNHVNPELEGIAKYVSLDEIYERSDVISLHIPMNEKNYHMINKESISKMKTGVLLINTARGELIDSNALIEALEKEKIGGAGIDTVEEEKGIMHVHVGTKVVENRLLMYLKQFPNVVYTQHYAFYTEEACESMVECGLKSLYLEEKERENPYRIC